MLLEELESVEPIHVVCDPCRMLPGVTQTSVDIIERAEKRILTESTLGRIMNRFPERSDLNQPGAYIYVFDEETGLTTRRHLRDGESFRMDDHLGAVSDDC